MVSKNTKTCAKVYFFLETNNISEKNRRTQINLVCGSIPFLSFKTKYIRFKTGCYNV